VEIVFVVENYYPKTSGVPAVTKYLAEGLVNKGIQVTVITRCVKNRPHHELINGVKVNRFNLYYNFLKMNCGNKQEYINFVLSYECDAIIFECSQCITTDIILPYLRKIKTATLFHSHGFAGLTLKPFKKNSTLAKTIGNTYNWLRWNLYYKFYFKKYVNAFNTTICLSKIDSSINYLKKNAKNVSVLSNAADDMFFSKYEKNNLAVCKYTKLKNKSYCISIANYQEYKNQIGILEQFYKSGIIDYDMVFIGSSKSEYYEKLIYANNKYKKTYGNRGIHFLTNVDRKDIPLILNNATLYLVGSSFEEFSISLIEAMAMGIPFISTNVGNAVLLPGGVTINSIDQMSNEIFRLINSKEVYKQYSECGKIYALDNCRVEAIVNKLTYIISNI
jgi:glycosyltransferase involved in cell wall biosynthesis